MAEISCQSSARWQSKGAVASGVLAKAHVMIDVLVLVLVQGESVRRTIVCNTGPAVLSPSCTE